MSKELISLESFKSYQKYILFFFANLFSCKEYNDMLQS